MQIRAIGIHPHRTRRQSRDRLLEASIVAREWQPVTWIGTRADWSEPSPGERSDTRDLVVCLAKCASPRNIRAAFSESGRKTRVSLRLPPK